VYQALSGRLAFRAASASGLAYIRRYPISDERWQLSSRTLEERVDGMRDGLIDQ